MRNIITFMAFIAATSAYANHGKIRYTYHESINGCQDRHGFSGFNPAQPVECGDLKDVTKRGGAITESLAGTYWQNTVLENVDLRKSSLHGASFQHPADNGPVNSLRGSDLRGVDLSGTQLQFVYLEGAKFSIQTKLFDGSLEDQGKYALERGMIFYVGDRAITDKEEVLKILRAADGSGRAQLIRPTLPMTQQGYAAPNAY